MIFLPYRKMQAYSTMSGWKREHITTNNSESESRASEHVQGSGQNNDERIQIRKKTDAAETPVIRHAGRYNVKHIERGSRSGALFFL